VSRFLAIDPDADGLFVLAGVLTKSGPQVERVAALPAPSGGGERPLTAARMGELGTRLKQLLQEADIKPAPVLLVLGRDRVILKEVTYPPCEPADEPALVRAQATRDLVEAAGDVLMDYTPIDTRPSGLAASGIEDAPLRHAQVVIVRKDIVVAARVLCEAAGLKLAGVTPRPHALAAALPNPEDLTQAVAGAVLWEGGGEFVVRRGTELLYARTLSPAASQSEAAFAGELRRNLTVFGGQRGAVPVESLYVAESPRAGSAARLGQTLPIQVRTLDPLAGADAGGAPDAARGRFAALVGVLALRARGPVMPINFTTPRQPKAEPRKGKLKVALVALGALAVVAAAAALGWMRLDSADTRLEVARARKVSAEEALKRTELDAKRLAAADEFASREVNILDELYDLADRIPDVSKVKATAVAFDDIKQQRAGPARPGTPKVDPAKVPATPAAKLVVTVVGTDEKAELGLSAAFQADKFYKSTSRKVSLIKGKPVVELTTEVMHRPVADYVRRLKVTMPPKPAAKPDPEDFGGDF
jgi:hypothetical protein